MRCYLSVFFFVFMLSACAQPKIGITSLKPSGNTRDLNDLFFPSEGTFNYIENSVESPVVGCSSLFNFQMPYDHNNPTGRKFTYHVDIVNRGALKTVIRIEGGPGGSARGNVLPNSSAYNVVNIIPRGIDCNLPGTAPSDYFTLSELNSLQHAKDIKKVITEFDIQNYVVWGHSYGTVPATILGSMLDDLPLINQPKAILLEGTIGDAGLYNIPAHFFNELLDQSSGIKDIFNSQSLPLSISEASWASYIPGLMVRGPTFALSLLEEVKEIDESGNNTQKETARGALDSILGNLMDFSKGGASFWFAVFCQELRNDVPEWNKGRFVSGVLNYNSATDSNSALNSYCRSIENQRYSPVQYQVDFPLYYINGNWDANTPIEKALVHYNSQVIVNKRFTTVVSGGHSPLSDSEYGELRSCAGNIWNAIFNLSNLTTVLNGQGHCN